MAACSSYAVDNDWQWKVELENSVMYADNSIKNLELGSYWNKNYRSAVFSVANLIPTGINDAEFDAEQYRATLLGIWNNKENIRVLNDELIRLAALKWLINLKTKCFENGVDTKAAREYFTEMTNSKENMLINSAVTGFGLIGEKIDVDILLEMLIENQDNYIGDTALDAILLIQDHYMVTRLNSRMDEISNDSVKRKIEKELSYKRTIERRCDN